MTTRVPIGNEASVLEDIPYALFDTPFHKIEEICFRIGGFLEAEDRVNAGCVSKVFRAGLYNDEIITVARNALRPERRLKRITDMEEEDPESTSPTRLSWTTVYDKHIFFYMASLYCNVALQWILIAEQYIPASAISPTFVVIPLVLYALCLVVIVCSVRRANRRDVLLNAGVLVLFIIACPIAIYAKSAEIFHIENQFSPECFFKDNTTNSDQKYPFTVNISDPHGWKLNGTMENVPITDKKQISVMRATYFVTEQTNGRVCGTSYAANKLLTMFLYNDDNPVDAASFRHESRIYPSALWTVFFADSVGAFASSAFAEKFWDHGSFIPLVMVNEEVPWISASAARDVSDWCIVATAIVMLLFYVLMVFWCWVPVYRHRKKVPLQASVEGARSERSQFQAQMREMHGIADVEEVDYDAATEERRAEN